MHGLYLHGVYGGEDDLVGGDDDGEELGGELQHGFVLKHHRASNLTLHALLKNLTDDAIA